MTIDLIEHLSMLLSRTKKKSIGVSTKIIKTQNSTFFLAKIVLWKSYVEKLNNFARIENI